MEEIPIQVEKKEEVDISVEFHSHVEQTDEIQSQNIEPYTRIPQDEMSSQYDSEYEVVTRGRQKSKKAIREHQRNKSLKSVTRMSIGIDDGKMTLKERAKSCNPNSYSNQTKSSTSTTKNERRVRFNDDVQEMKTLCSPKVQVISKITSIIHNLRIDMYCYYLTKLIEI